MWLSYIGQLLKSAVDIAAALEVHNRPVMVHCTDGWDRTPQLTSLAKLLLDPYYRTIEVRRLHFSHVPFIINYNLESRPTVLILYALGLFLGLSFPSRA